MPPTVRCAAAIFFEYCKRGSSGAKTIAEALTLSTREFAAFVRETEMGISVADVNEVFRRVDRGEKKKQDRGREKSDQQLVFAEFVEALIRLSAKVMGGTATGRKALQAGNAAYADLIQTVRGTGYRFSPRDLAVL